MALMTINTKEAKVNPKEIFFRSLEAQKIIGDIALELGYKFLTQDKPTRKIDFVESYDLLDPFSKERG